MLLSMTENERATRAEISDVANAVLDGTDVVMLSEESAVGTDPINVVQTMSNIIAKTEEIYNFDKQSKLAYLDEFDVIQGTVTKLADDLGAKGILALTSSGKSAMKISRYRPKTKILAFSHKRKVLNSLSAIWGVYPITVLKEGQASKMIQKMLKNLESRNILDKTGPYIATIGYPAGIPGSTNTIKILTEGEIEYYLNLPTNKKK
jgi:pyruvate kinase